MRVFKTHVARPLSDTVHTMAGAASFRRPVCCPEHNGEAVRMFCTTCNKAACVVCAIVKHKGHDVVDTATASAGMRDRLRAAVAAVGFDASAEGTFKTALAAKIAHVTGVHGFNLRDRCCRGRTSRRCRRAARRSQEGGGRSAGVPDGGAAGAGEEH